MVAERALDERRYEGAEERSSHAGEESAEPDTQAYGVRRALGRTSGIIGHARILAFGRSFRIVEAPMDPMFAGCRTNPADGLADPSADGVTHEYPDGSDGADYREEYGKRANESPTHYREERTIHSVSAELAITDSPQPER